MRNLTKSDVQEMNDVIFVNACKNGDLELAKCFFEKGVDIHTWDDASFKYACANGHIEVANWLLEKGVDIYAYEAFRG